MFFKKEVKISKNFGEEYIEKVIAFLSTEFTISFKRTNVIEMDLILYDYIIDENEVTFLSESRIGTSILGKKKIIEKIKKKMKEENTGLFDV
ncbi:hypothetical protein [Flavobacterium sp.]|uniref:hypothetical protein n=1 Tax=Flavobacterium sp. TaxID=239 RepID=UPI00263217E9|nr:hypothetical protein [Flavobacterium sp.]